MGTRRRSATWLAAGAVAAVVALGRADATVGMAEWQIYTPGGHLIAHSDAWKAEHGDCLLRKQGDRPLIAHLQRWRYYPGLVLGQTTTDSFVLDETTEAVSRFPDARAAELALGKRSARPPLSGWLTAEDGWTEAWFPLLVWPRCQQRGALDARTKAICDRYLSPEGLALARATTWGRTCAAARVRGGSGGSAGSPPSEPIAAWCKLIAGAASEPR